MIQADVNKLCAFETANCTNEGKLLQDRFNGHVKILLNFQYRTYSCLGALVSLLTSFFNLR